MKYLEPQLIKEIYHLMADDISKAIFENRIMYSLTQDAIFLNKIMKMSPILNSVIDRLRNSKLEKVIVGAGRNGRRFKEIFSDIEFCAFVDNYCEIETIDEIPILRLEELSDKKEDILFVITTRVYYKELHNQLREFGIKDNNIINLGEVYNEEIARLQYFDLPYLQAGEKEIFVDGGCYDGNTTLEFKKWCIGKRVKDYIVYAWEPDFNNFQKSKKRFDAEKIKYTLIPNGIWDKKEKMSFKMEGTESSFICETGGMK